MEKTNFGTVAAKVSLAMKSKDFIGKVMLQNWMNIADHFGNISSLCLSDFGNIALDTKTAKNGDISVTIHFSPK